jgi:hypothetical protein
VWVRTVLIALSIAGLVASFVLASWLGADTPPLASLTANTPRDAAAADRLRAGRELENEGKLAAALGEYRQALGADSPTLRQQALAGLDRGRDKQRALLPAWIGFRWDDVLQTVVKLRIVFVLVLLLALFDIGSQRRGIGIRVFPVFGTADGAAADAFRQYLFAALRDHQRVFASGWLRPVGGVPSGDLLLLSPDAADAWGRALESAKTAELKSVVAFSLGELLQFLRSRRERPAYLISGQVRCGERETFVKAELRSLVNDAFFLREQASSTEYPPRPFGTVRPDRRVTSLPSGLLVTEDLRANHEQLAQAAWVLAAKLWHGLAQAARSDLRPVSWQTFLRLVRAMAPYVRP